MERLGRLDLKGTGIKDLPSSIVYLTGLESFTLPGCKNLPSSILQLQNLKFIHLDDCSGLKFLKEVGDNRQSMPSIMSTDDCSSTAFQSLREVSLRDGVLSESDFFTKFNCSSTLENLDLSGSDIVSLPACIKRFVKLRYLWLNDCKQLQEILELPPNILEVYAAGCISLERFPEVPKKCQCSTPDSRALHWIDLSKCNKMVVNTGDGVPNPLWDEGHFKNHRFGIIFPENRIPDWFNHRKEISHSELFDTGCIAEDVEEHQIVNGFVGSGIPDWAINRKEEIDINEPLCLDEIRGIAFCAVFGPIHSIAKHEVIDNFSIGVEINGVRLERLITQRTFDSRGSDPAMCSEHVWLDYFVGESFKLQGDNLRVKLFCSSKSVFFKGFGVHMIRKQEERVKSHLSVLHEDGCLGAIFNFCLLFSCLLGNQTVDGEMHGLEEIASEQ